MTRLLRTVRTPVFAIAAAGLLASCSDESGVLDVYFGSRGSGACDSISVTIDLAAADALLAPGFTDEKDCNLPQILEDTGCDLDVVMLDGGARARVTVSGCGDLDSTQPLFRCGFSDGELEDITFVSKGSCDCATAPCDATPPLCINDNPDLDDCERCNNGSDDDNNGSVDCEDPACENHPACNDSTTSTSSTSSSTQPGSSSTTSSTIPSPVAQKYAVTFSIDNGQNIGALQFDIAYGNAALRARAAVTDPVCRKLVDTALASFDYDTGAQTVHVSMSNLTGIAGPTDLVECTFESSSQPDASDFSLHVTAALNLQGQPIASPPPVEVGGVVPVTTTTTEAGVTTTLNITTTTDDGPTTTTLPESGDPFTVTFRLTSASTAVGALQFHANYLGSGGNFQGHGSGVSCTNLVADTLFAPNDKDVVCSLDQTKVCTSEDDCRIGSKGTCSVVKKELVIGIISLTSFDAPIDVVSCVFLASAGDTPTPSDFTIGVEEATDGAGDPISAAVGVTIVARP